MWSSSEAISQTEMTGENKEPYASIELESGEYEVSGFESGEEVKEFLTELQEGVEGSVPVYGPYYK